MPGQDYFQNVQRLATDLRHGDRQHVLDASTLLAQEGTSGDALQLLTEAVKLNQQNGLRNVDRVQIEPNGDIIVSDPYGQNSNRIKFSEQMAVRQPPPPPVYGDQPVVIQQGQPGYRVEQPVQDRPNNAVKYGVLGGVAGAVSGDNSKERLKRGVIGAIVGGVVGDVVDQNNQNADQRQQQRRR